MMLVYFILLKLIVHATAEKSWCDVMVEDEGWFRCANRQSPYCLSPYYRCDGEQHCTDNSDEENCSDNAPEANHRSLDTYCLSCSSLELAVLDHHNKLRRQEPASNMNELQWNSETYKQAKAQADLCRLSKWGENPHGNMEPDHSQNVARMYIDEQLPDWAILRLVDAWYDEKKDYSYTDDTCSAKCGHYTVLVTAYARNVGCALVKCDRTQPDTEEHIVFWNFVCNYSPGFNWHVWTTHPDQPFIKGESCSKCQPGLECRNNLCA